MIWTYHSGQYTADHGSGEYQDPGNLGTIVRTGEGAGITGVIMSNGTVDIYNPKTIRATMGSVYRVPFCYAENMQAVMQKLKK